MPNNPIDPSVDDIKLEESSLPQEPDIEDQKEAATLEGEQVQYLKQQNENLRTLRELRKIYAGKVYEFMVGWAMGVFMILVLQGFGFYGFSLDTTVLTTLVGGTTVSVIGLVGFMVKGLFPNLSIKDRKAPRPQRK